MPAMMNILIATNSDYILPSRVMLRSLLKNEPSPLRLFVLYRTLAEEEKALLRRDAEESGHAELRLIRVDPVGMEEGPWRLSWISAETYFRLLAQELLPRDADRVLWLDSDLIIRGPVAEFYHQELEGKLLAACGSAEEPGDGKPSCSDPFPKDMRYFNAGVLLYDLKAQRESIDPSLYRQIPEAFGDRLKLGDQDILNLVFYRRVKYADPRKYNRMAYDIGDREELERTVILHYNGIEKPWRYTYRGKWAECFWEYAEELPEYRALKPGLLAAQRQYAADTERSRRTGALLDAKRKEYRKREAEGPLPPPEKFDRHARYQLAEGARLIRTGTQNLLLMEPGKRRVFNELLRLNDTGALLAGGLQTPRTAEELAALLHAAGRHSLRDARTNAVNLMKLLNGYRLLRRAEEAPEEA